MSDNKRRNELTTIQLTRAERAAIKRKKRGDETYADLFRRRGLI
ncbi:MAG: hypothetical protein PHC39_04470 [Proteiniphilum sp.]|nr:hypothetical protein [Proteiniphilum sp.]